MHIPHVSRRRRGADDHPSPDGVSNPGYRKARPRVQWHRQPRKTCHAWQFQGQTVVLEWTDHDCPYVRKHYGVGNMQAIQRDTAKDGVVWLQVIS